MGTTYTVFDDGATKVELDEHSTVFDLCIKHGDNYIVHDGYQELISNMTVYQLIQLAGGLVQAAYYTHGDLKGVLAKALADRPDTVTMLRHLMRDLGE